MQIILISCRFGPIGLCVFYEEEAQCMLASFLLFYNGKYVLCLLLYVMHLSYNLPLRCLICIIFLLEA
jgi:hypothetical protein